MPSIGELGRYCGRHVKEFETITTHEDLHVNFVSDDVITQNEGFIVTFTDRQGYIIIETRKTRLKGRT